MVECFLGTKPTGYSCKLGNGEVEKGLATGPKLTSLVKFSLTYSDCAKAVGAFFENRAARGQL